MKRTPLTRKTPLARGPGPQRREMTDSRKPLPARSQKRKAETVLRESIRTVTFARANQQCEAQHLVPDVKCAGPLDCDERIGRGVRPGAHLDVTITQALCRAHHSWKHENPEASHEVGLTFWSHEYEQAKR